MTIIASAVVRNWGQFGPAWKVMCGQALAKRQPFALALIRTHQGANCTQLGIIGTSWSPQRRAVDRTALFRVLLGSRMLGPAAVFLGLGSSSEFWRESRATSRWKGGIVLLNPSAVQVKWSGVKGGSMLEEYGIKNHGNCQRSYSLCAHHEKRHGLSI